MNKLHQFIRRNRISTPNLHSIFENRSFLLKPIAPEKEPNNQEWSEMWDHLSLSDLEASSLMIFESPLRTSHPNEKIWYSGPRGIIKWIEIRSGNKKEIDLYNYEAHPIEGFKVEYALVEGSEDGHEVLVNFQVSNKEDDYATLTFNDWVELSDNWNKWEEADTEDATDEELMAMPNDIQRMVDVMFTIDWSEFNLLPRSHWGLDEERLNTKCIIFKDAARELMLKLQNMEYLSKIPKGL